MTYGVLTAANKDFWRTLNTLVRSCIGSDIPIAVFDHGLLRQQREWLTRRGALVFDGSQRYEADLAVIAANHKNFNPKAPPEAWFKPLVCLDSPFDRTIWIDADAVLLRGGEEMFAALDDGPWLTRDWWIDAKQAGGLYESLVLAIHGSLPPDYCARVHVNTGVFGFRRGDSFLEGWREMCHRITGDPSLLEHCRCRDQSAFAAWLAGCPADAPRFIENPGWNYPANGKASRDARDRKRYPPNLDLLPVVREDHPEAYVVHWLGRPKPQPEVTTWR